MRDALIVGLRCLLAVRWNFYDRVNSFLRCRHKRAVTYLHLTELLLAEGAAVQLARLH